MYGELTIKDMAVKLHKSECYLGYLISLGVFDGIVKKKYINGRTKYIVKDAAMFSDAYIRRKEIKALKKNIRILPNGRPEDVEIILGGHDHKYKVDHKEVYK